MHAHVRASEDMCICTLYTYTIIWCVCITHIYFIETRYVCCKVCTQGRQRRTIVDCVIFTVVFGVMGVVWAWEGLFFVAHVLAESRSESVRRNTFESLTANPSFDAILKHLIPWNPFAYACFRERTYSRHGGSHWFFWSRRVIATGTLQGAIRCTLGHCTT